MSDPGPVRYSHNPFATRFVAPGKLPWIAPGDGLTIDALHRRFVTDCHRRAAIVGPHGSGKSTLLENLVPLLGKVLIKLAAYDQATVPKLDEPVMDVIWLKLRGRRPSKQLLVSSLRSCRSSSTVVVLDGYEQLSSSARLTAWLITRSRGQGLLVTTHKSSWLLPTLVQTEVTPELAQQVTASLLPADFPDRARLLDQDTLAQLLAKHHGNLREVYMDLYDVYVCPAK